MLRVPVPFVEKHVPQACAQNGAGNGPQEYRTHPALRSALVAEHAVKNTVPDQKTDGKHQAVPAHSYKRIYDYGICVPGDKVENHCMSLG